MAQHSSAARRHAEDVKRVEDGHAAKASKLLSHSSGEQLRLKQHHVEKLKMMDQLREEELAALTREHERALAAQDKECRGILGAAKALLPPDELEKVTRIAYLASIGKAAGTVADMEPRRRRDLGKVASV